MEISNWITLGAAILVGSGTLFLGIMAWRTIRQTRNIQKAEKREGLLNEIIEWATKSAESAIYRQKTDNSELWKTKLNYKVCRAKSEYIKGIATSSFSNLSSHIIDIVTKLDEAIESTTRLIDSKLSENYDQVRHCEEELTNAVIGLFEKAAKIKTKAID